MAITTYAGNTLTGLSTDIKPITIPDGARFFETDTGITYNKVLGLWEDKISITIQALSDRIDVLEAV
jgi:hypothetical protein